MSVNGALRMAAALGAGGATDPYWSNVKLLAHFDNNWTDSKGLHTITATNAVLSTTNGRASWGGYSAYFDGNGDYLTLGTSTDFTFGTGDFTVELWFYNNATTVHGMLFSTVSDISTTGGLRVSTGNNNRTMQVATAMTNLGDASSAFSNTTWNHVALARSGTSLKLFLNGTTVLSVTNSTSFTSDTFYIGNCGGLGSPYYLNAYVDDFRITKGTARYTADFTPPTAAFPNG